MTEITHDNAGRVLSPYEAGIVEMYGFVQDSLDELRRQTVETVRHGAQLGACIHEGRRKHRDEFWGWMRGLTPDVREDVVKFALRAYLFRERNPELDDPSQLTFALASGDEPEPTTGEAQKRDAGEIAALTRQVMSLTAQLNRMKSTPVKRWDPSVKASVREMLRPLVEVWEMLR